MFMATEMRSPVPSHGSTLCDSQPGKITSKPSFGLISARSSGPMLRKSHVWGVHPEARHARVVEDELPALAVAYADIIDRGPVGGTVDVRHVECP